MAYTEKEFVASCDFCPRRNGDEVCGTCPKKVLFAEAMQMQEFLEATPSDNPAELVSRLGIINTYLARSGFLMAQAQKMQDETIANIFHLASEQIVRMSATIANKFVMAHASDVNSLYLLLERQNRAFVHQGENLRTQISFAKQEVELQRRGY